MENDQSSWMFDGSRRGAATSECVVESGVGRLVVVKMYKSQHV